MVPTSKMVVERLIITAASAGYEQSLLALIGSLNCNWPDHPPVLVYNLGMSSQALELLHANGILLREVPPFVPHWREDYTWKIWCFRDAPARTYLWLDAGLCVFRPLDEAFCCAERLGYFAVSLYNHPVLPSVPPFLLKSIGLSIQDVSEMISISSGIHSICKEGRGLLVLTEAFNLCQVHANLEATEPMHRHDQALLTLLLYKYFGSIVLSDYHVYAYHYPFGPGEVSRQKIWVHRRKMLPGDIAYFLQHLSGTGMIYRPVDYIRRKPISLLRRIRVLLAKARRRYPGEDVININKYLSHGLKD